jgi:hypothetical protein
LNSEARVDPDDTAPDDKGWLDWVAAACSSSAMRRFSVVLSFFRASF